MRLVLALGGNALLQRRQRADIETQRRNLGEAAAGIAALASHHALVVSHGNGPQVGLLALQAEACAEVPPYPLDALGAETEGLLGYLIEQEIRNRLPGREVATLLTQVEVAPDDAAFARPDKPIGPLYEESEARRLAARRGWQVARDGDAWRRVVPSPEPRRIVELNAIRLLVDHGALVICTGGGGIPVVVTPAGALVGVEAVIDKDLAAARLALDLGFEALLMLTDVAAVYADWPDRRRPIRAATPTELRARRFAPGSMAPKVEAACRFVEAGGAVAGIGHLDSAAAILAGESGTRVLASTG